MVKKLLSLMMFVSLATFAMAKDPVFRQTGTLTEMISVNCGTDENRAQGLGSVLLGTDSAHTKSKQMLCQEYTLKAPADRQGESIVYRIRPTEEKHPVLLPIGSEVRFRIKKDRLLLSASDGDGKERSYVVTSMVTTSNESGKGR